MSKSNTIKCLKNVRLQLSVSRDSKNSFLFTHGFQRMTNDNQYKLGKLKKMSNKTSNPDKTLILWLFLFKCESGRITTI